MKEKNKYLDIALDLNDWFKLNNHKGLDPFQLDEKVFGLVNKLPFLSYIRSFLKPFHTRIPTKVFSMNKGIIHPKALGLAISSNSYLYKETSRDYLIEENDKLIKMLKKCRSENEVNYCWGHPFSWGDRPRYPKNIPLVCVTAPIGHWILDFINISGRMEYYEICCSIAENLLEEKKWHNLDSSHSSIFYSDIEKNYTYNGAALVSSFLYRMNQIETNSKWIEKANNLINFIIDEQNLDGSWYYSIEMKEKKDKTTIDNRHTGYILEHLAIINSISPTAKLKQKIDKGSEYYIDNLFDEDKPKWSPYQTYPIDIHDVAQAIITLLEIEESSRAQSILNFSIEKMFDGKNQFYYKYFKNGRVNKSVFIRWGQAWMYNAICKYISMSKIK